MTGVLTFEHSHHDQSVRLAWEAFRRAREVELREPYGTLSTVLRQVLTDRPQRVPGIPGAWRAVNSVGGVTVTVTDASGLETDGDTGQEIVSVQLAEDGSQTEFWAGSRRIRVGVLGEERVTMLRVNDPDSVTRRDFRGIPSWDFNPDLILPARYLPTADDRSLLLSTVIDGIHKRLPQFGDVLFNHAGTEYRLAVYAGSATELHVPFWEQLKDGAPRRVRVIAVEAPEGDFSRPFNFALDFNRALNGPNALTAHASCALPPASNTVRFPVHAGEKPAPWLTTH